jgi:hypothetical protein
MTEFDWQTQMVFLDKYPELHSLLAAYIAIEELELPACVRLFSQQNPRSVAKVVAQLDELRQQADAQLLVCAIKLAGVKFPKDTLPNLQAQAWLAELHNHLLEVMS